MDRITYAMRSLTLFLRSHAYKTALPNRFPYQHHLVDFLDEHLDALFLFGGVFVAVILILYRYRTRHRGGKQRERIATTWRNNKLPRWEQDAQKAIDDEEEVWQRQQLAGHRYRNWAMSPLQSIDRVRKREKDESGRARQVHGVDGENDDLRRRRVASRRHRRQTTMEGRCVGGLSQDDLGRILAESWMEEQPGYIAGET